MCRAHRHWNSTSYRTAAGSTGKIYGAEGSRTPDLCSAIAALSQLSYSPESGARQPFYSFRSHSGFNDTTPLARGRTVDTKAIRAGPEVQHIHTPDDAGSSSVTA